MWLKIAGSILIFSAATILGFGVANRYSERPRQIRQVISCLTSLSSYINYAALPLADALVNCAGGTEGPVAEMFIKAGTRLKQNGWLSPHEALQASLDELQAKLVFRASEQEILSAMGATLGALNREEQNKYFNMVLEQLKILEQEALRRKEQNVKMYRYLGICGGSAVILLLI